MKKLAVLLERGANSFGLLRFLLASLVIYSHSYPLGGLGRESITPVLTETFGSVAVAGFFVISGFLIAASYDNSATIFHFVWNRCLRIMPGFWFCLLVNVALFGVLQSYSEGASLTDYPAAALAFVQQNFFLKMNAFNIGGLLAGHPHPHAWGGSLWSLIYEFRCYLMVGVMGFFGLLALGRWMLLVTYFAAIGLFVLDLLTPGTAVRVVPYFNDPWGLKLYIYFMSGMVGYAFRESVVLVPKLAAGALVLWVYAINELPVAYPVISLFTLPYLVLWAAEAFPAKEFDRDADYSYGIYLYGFSVQQILVTAGVHQLGVLPFFALSLLVTFPFAWLSYHAVEKQALKMKNFGRRGLRERLRIPPRRGDECRS